MDAVYRKWEEQKEDKLKLEQNYCEAEEEDSKEEHTPENGQVHDNLEVPYVSSKPRRKSTYIGLPDKKRSSAKRASKISNGAKEPTPSGSKHAHHNSFAQASNLHSKSGHKKGVGSSILKMA